MKANKHNKLMSARTPLSLLRKNMYSGGENVQMNGDTPHDGGHGGGGHGDCEELQRTGR